MKFQIKITRKVKDLPKSVKTKVEEKLEPLKKYSRTTDIHPRDEKKCLYELCEAVRSIEVLFIAYKLDLKMITMKRDHTWNIIIRKKRKE